MKAIISDLHSNIEALEAVFDDIDRLGIKDVYCLGDIIGYGPNPIECLKLVRERCKLVITGNHDRAIYDKESCESFNVRASKAIKWTIEQLEEIPDALDYLRNLPEVAEIDGIMCVHASPLDPIREYVTPQYAIEKRRLALLFEHVPNFCFVGHTHIPGVFTDRLTFNPPEKLFSNLYMLDPGNEKALINVGSVGQPRDSKVDACYVTFDGDSVVFRRVPYAKEKTRGKILGIPALDDFLGNRLLAGR
ncbi:MAG: phosphoesterase [Planctomycetota bacterium]|nr:MAG: phosphoesterase [Planctomycetota bacterium]